MLGLTILGNNSAIPAFDRHPTSQVLSIGSQILMFDCGEGTQMQMATYKVKKSKLSHIFISHLHGDHYFGLIGLLTSLALSGRTEPLHLFAPAPLEKIIDLQLQVSNSTLPYQLVFTAITANKILVKTSKFMVESFETFHRIESYGFKVTELIAARKLNKEKAVEHGIPAAFYESLKQGFDYTDKQGNTIPNEWVTYANRSPKTFAFCGDSLYHEQVQKCVENVDLLYHETTYLQAFEDRAAERFHCTTKQAATLALNANAKHLIIGHFSAKYNNLDDYLAEAKAVFNNTSLALEGITFRF